MQRAILIVGGDDWTVSATRLRERRSLAEVDVLGSPVCNRVIDNVRQGVAMTSVFTDRNVDDLDFDGLSNVELHHSPDVWLGVFQELAEAKDADAVLIAHIGAYIDFDPEDLFRFYRKQGTDLVRAHDDKGELDLWVVNSAMLPLERDPLATMRRARGKYQVVGHVNRLEGLRDLRQLAIDGLTGRCRLRPQGFEVRPGVWMHEKAVVEKEARIVAPAFIGREAMVSNQCLVTRCSTVEFGAYIDYGTAVEDASILPNSYVGIGLDVSHSIVDGNDLYNLHHDVTLEILDPAVMRRNSEGMDYQLASTGFGRTVVAARESGKEE